MNYAVDCSPVQERFTGPGHQKFVQPVDPGIEKILLEGADENTARIAYTLATCAGYSYSDAPTLARSMAGLGLLDAKYLVMREQVDAMSIWSTGYLIQSSTGKVAILCYRGTEPLNLDSWLTNVDVTSQTFSFKLVNALDAQVPQVHGGFYRNVEGTFPTLLEALRRAVEGCSILGEDDEHQDRLEPLEQFYITGHSLGGAMAVLAAAQLASSRSKWWLSSNVMQKGSLKVFTFGQPMVGNAAFAAACKQLKFKLHRYVHRYDIVPRLPSADVVGSFEHFGKANFLAGKIQSDQPPPSIDQSPPSLEEAQEILARIAMQILSIGLRRGVEEIFEENAGSPAINGPIDFAWQVIKFPADVVGTAVDVAGTAVRELGNLAEQAFKRPFHVAGEILGAINHPAPSNHPTANSAPSTRAEFPEENWPPQAPTVLDVLISARASFLEKLKASDAAALHCSLTDHAPNLYIDALKPQYLTAFTAFDGGLTGDRYQFNLLGTTEAQTVTT